MARSTTSTTELRRCTGKERDTETGLDFFKVRYFGSPQGRFTSPDPFSPIGLKLDRFNAWISNPQRWNKYAYALNNPLAFIDPSGMNACGTNNDTTCKVTITITPRTKDENGNYSDQFANVANQAGYNATAVVSVNGEVQGTYLAKTTPDDSNKSGTLAAGVYQGTLVVHKGQYRAIGLTPDSGVPTTGPNPHQYGSWFAANIHLHHAGIGNATVARTTGPISEGCQTIATSQWDDFTQTTGISPADGSARQQHFTVSVDTPENFLYADPVLPGVPES
jgi:RHS repeat-associated protein